MYSRFASIEDLDNLQDKQQERVRAEPTSATERFRLFQVLSMRGRWDDAKRQLQQALSNDASLLPMIRSYQFIIDAELQRDRCWRGEAPVSMAALAIEDWATHLAEDCAQLDAPERLASNLANAPALRGEIDVVREGAQDIHTHEFQWIADGDGRLGPMLELIGPQGYGWMPLTRVREIEIAAPQNGVDRLWARAVLTLTSGERQRTTMPVRYVGDYASLSSSLLLGQETCWRALGDKSLQLFAGVGQRMWITDQDEYALLDVRAVRLQGGAA
ncbi:type VI secretion system accessory protein TagJ [Pseudomonas sp. SCB32]|uniref:type VI secretion system accessory protein TagJ n=1 Tax=Pseudomonas sp. SCB32 TaxID=2653853 RepID=UPI0015B706A8|nr:type VI secretion system accessory protein TagJ [Pseudomonas sp. SCB32]